jgi:Flp pilus assembly protein TadG
MSVNKERKSRGAILLEFAIILPFLLLMLAGIWDLGHYIFRGHVLERAAREGAVRASRELDPSFANSREAILAYLQESTVTNPEFAGVSITLSGSEVTVTVTYDYGHPTLFPFIIVPQDLTARATARRE